MCKRDERTCLAGHGLAVLLASTRRRCALNGLRGQVSMDAEPHGAARGAKGEESLLGRYLVIVPRTLTLSAHPPKPKTWIDHAHSEPR